MMVAKMKKQTVSLLKRYPSLYPVVEKMYYTLSYHRLKEYLLGTKVREREWATRHLRRSEGDWGKSDNNWVKSYWNSRDHTHRPFLIERISNFSPISSILEVGCNCGPNLYLLAKKFPNAKIRGIDINPIAVQKGNEWLANEGIFNVNLLVGKADGLGRFPDRSFDVVFTDAVLIYIGPDKIKETVKGMIRVTQKVLILVEWHSFKSGRKDPYGLGVYQYGNWKRDYIALLKQFVREEQIRITKIPEDVWPDRAWKEFGAVIEVVCNK
jgi:ubiquinone/menaquinone biosynthesis C-methylase UbiE